MEISEEIYVLAKELGMEDLCLPEIEVSNGSLAKILPYLQEKEYKNILLVVDDNTYEAAGKQLKNTLAKSGLNVNLVMLEANQHNQVIADESALVQLLVETPQNTDVCIAVGTGTIHDITRFCGQKMTIPFISVPTAASVDGFTSKGAPLILKGVKRTIQTASPIAVFADIDILKNAPREMTAAGFGDILAKYTSLLDWKISELIGEEPYNQLAADMTRNSLAACVENASKIAAGDDEGIKILIHSLIESGLVMLLLDFSKPASGGEHHLSHYWEMDLLKKEAKQLLHGAKVGVATAIIIDLYKRSFENIDENRLMDSTLTDRLTKHHDQILSMINQLPNPRGVRNLLKEVGGPATTEELNLDNELVAISLNEAFRLRERCTGLYLLNQFKETDIPYSLDKEGAL